jgi:hypothetical protein
LWNYIPFQLLCSFSWHCPLQFTISQFDISSPSIRIGSKNVIWPLRELIRKLLQKKSFLHITCIGCYVMSVSSIDISWVDWACKSSTCDVMYCRQRRHLQYIMVVKFRNSICPPPPQLSLHRRAALSSSSNGTRSVYSKEPQKAVYIVRCLWWVHVWTAAYVSRWADRCTFHTHSSTYSDDSLCHLFVISLQCSFFG